MEIRVCPECNKAFYAPQDGETLICPHCGYILLDRRRKERLRKEVLFTFSIKGRKVPARVRDYSDGGIKVVYKGQAVQVDTVLDLDIKELNIRRPAKAVWSARVSKSICSVGLKLL